MMGVPDEGELRAGSERGVAGEAGQEGEGGGTQECGICRKPTDRPADRKVYTAVRVRSMPVFGGEPGRATPVCTDLREHTYSVCDSCRIKWGVVAPVVTVLLALSASSLLVAWLKQWAAGADLATDLCLFGGAGLAAAGFALWLRGRVYTIDQLLIDRAIEARGGGGSSLEFQGFTSSQYERLRFVDR